MTNPTAAEIADMRRILAQLNVPGVDLATDDAVVLTLLDPDQALAVSNILIPAMADDDQLSPADRLILAHFSAKYATGIPSFKALVAAAKLTITAFRAVGKYVSCAAHNGQIANVMMTDVPELRPLVLYAAAQDRSHLPDDEHTQGVCDRAIAELTSRYGA